MFTDKIRREFHKNKLGSGYGWTNAASYDLLVIRDVSD